MKKVVIKRVKRNKKTATTGEKLMAGLGLGSSLIGGVAMGSSHAPVEKPIVSTQKNTTSNSQKAEKAIKDFFTIPKAEAFGPRNPQYFFGDSGAGGDVPGEDSNFSDMGGPGGVYGDTGGDGNPLGGFTPGSGFDPTDTSNYGSSPSDYGGFDNGGATSVTPDITAPAPADTATNLQTLPASSPDQTTVDLGGEQTPESAQNSAVNTAADESTPAVQITGQTPAAPSTDQGWTLTPDQQKQAYDSLPSSLTGGYTTNGGDSLSDADWQSPVSVPNQTALGPTGQNPALQEEAAWQQQMNQTQQAAASQATTPDVTSTVTYNQNQTDQTGDSGTPGANYSGVANPTGAGGDEETITASSQPSAPAQQSLDDTQVVQATGEFGKGPLLNPNADAGLAPDVTTFTPNPTIAGNTVSPTGPIVTVTATPVTTANSATQPSSDVSDSGSTDAGSVSGTFSQTADITGNNLIEGNTATATFEPVATVSSNISAQLDNQAPAAAVASTGSSSNGEFGSGPLLNPDNPPSSQSATIAGNTVTTQRDNNQPVQNTSDSQFNQAGTNGAGPLFTDQSATSNTDAPAAAASAQAAASDQKAVTLDEIKAYQQNQNANGGGDQTPATAQISSANTTTNESAPSAPSQASTASAGTASNIEPTNITWNGNTGTDQFGNQYQMVNGQIQSADESGSSAYVGSVNSNIGGSLKVGYNLNDFKVVTATDTNGKTGYYFQDPDGKLVTDPQTIATLASIKEDLGIGNVKFNDSQLQQILSDNQAHPNFDASGSSNALNFIANQATVHNLDASLLNQVNAENIQSQDSTGQISDRTGPTNADGITLPYSAAQLWAESVNKNGIVSDGTTTDKKGNTIVAPGGQDFYNFMTQPIPVTDANGNPTGENTQLAYVSYNTDGSPHVSLNDKLFHPPVAGSGQADSGSIIISAAGIDQVTHENIHGQDYANSAGQSTAFNKLGQNAQAFMVANLYARGYDTVGGYNSSEINAFSNQTDNLPLITALQNADKPDQVAQMIESSTNLKTITQTENGTTRIYLVNPKDDKDLPNENPDQTGKWGVLIMPADGSPPMVGTVDGPKTTTLQADNGVSIDVTTTPDGRSFVSGFSTDMINFDRDTSLVVSGEIPGIGNVNFTKDGAFLADGSNKKIDVSPDQLQKVIQGQRSFSILNDSPNGIVAMNIDTQTGFMTMQMDGKAYVPGPPLSVEEGSNNDKTAYLQSSQGNNVVLEEVNPQDNGTMTKTGTVITQGADGSFKIDDGKGNTVTIDAQGHATSTGNVQNDVSMAAFLATLQKQYNSNSSDSGANGAGTSTATGGN